MARIKCKVILQKSAVSFVHVPRNSFARTPEKSVMNEKQLRACLCRRQCCLFTSINGKRNFCNGSFIRRAVLNLYSVTRRIGQKIFRFQKTFEIHIKFIQRHSTVPPPDCFFPAEEAKASCPQQAVFPLNHYFSRSQAGMP